MTAATDRYMIEAEHGKVNLCDSQGGSWVTICRDIDEAMARHRGFNLDSPAVRAVFAEASRCLAAHQTTLPPAPEATSCVAGPRGQRLAAGFAGSREKTGCNYE